MHTWYLRYLEGRIAELEQHIRALYSRQPTPERAASGRGSRQTAPDAVGDVVEIPVTDGASGDDGGEEPGGPATDPERAYV